jgi:hypothetical protein
MLVKAYYDCSMDASSVTLCGVQATESVWREFEPKWEAVLQKFQVKDNVLHMTYLMCLSRGFSRRHGWDEDRRRSLLTSLFNVIASFRGASYHLLARSCTVLLDDWRLAKEKLPMLRSPEEICVNSCVGGLALPRECVGERRPVQLYFDRNEKFMHRVRRVWERRKRQPGKFSQIDTIEKISSRHYALQAADLLAWIANRQKLHRQEAFVDSLRVMAILMIEHPSLRYDLETIFDHYPDGKLRLGTKN